MIGRNFPEKKPDFQFALRQSLLSELNLKIPKSDEEILSCIEEIEDGYRELQPGYRNT